MIKRLNFYDIYGYLLPGVLLLELLWLPYAVSGHELPVSADLLAALVGLATAYILGHAIQIWARLTFSLAKDGKSWEPSNTAVDDFTPDQRTELNTRVKMLLKADLDQIGRRHETFLLCRNLLLQRGIASYAEQFQGMYSLMRGSAMSCMLGALFQFGWFLTALSPSSWRTATVLDVPAMEVGALLVGGVAALWFLLRPQPKPDEKKTARRVVPQEPVPVGISQGTARTSVRYAFPLGLATLLAGVGFAIADTCAAGHIPFLGLLPIVSALIGRGAYRSYPFFAKGFAETVYQSVLLMDLENSPRPRRFLRRSLLWGAVELEDLEQDED